MLAKGINISNLPRGVTLKEWVVSEPAEEMPGGALLRADLAVAPRTECVD
jgi:hypothetical protein